MIAHLIASNYSKGASDNAIATAIADILLHVHRVKLCANNGPCRACLLAWGVGAVLADIALHQPAIGIEKGQSRARRRLWNVAVALAAGHLPPRQWNWGWQWYFSTANLLD